MVEQYGNLGLLLYCCKSHWCEHADNASICVPFSLSVCAELGRDFNSHSIITTKGFHRKSFPQYLDYFTWPSATMDMGVVCVCGHPAGYKHDNFSLWFLTYISIMAQDVEHLPKSRIDNVCV